MVGPDNANCLLAASEANLPRTLVLLDNPDTAKEVIMRRKSFPDSMLCGQDGGQLRVSVGW